MSLLVLADSQIERVWRSVRQDREILKTAEFVPVKRFNQMHDGFKAMKATVRLPLMFFVNEIGFGPVRTMVKSNYLIQCFDIFFKCIL